MIRPVLIARDKPLPGGAAGMTVFSLVAALAASALILELSGFPSGEALYEMAWGAFGDLYGLTEVIVKATPLLLCGLAVSIAFTMNLWNIGAEGQLYCGALASSWVALTFPDLPPVLMIGAMTLAGFVGGLVWALIPGLLKAKLQVNEIITTLMLNYVAIFLVDYFLYGPWKDPVSHGFPMTKLFPDAAVLPTLGDSRIHLGLAYGLAAALAVALLLGRTKLGFTMRVIGANRTAAVLSGMPVGRVIVVSLCLSGALAGVAGMSEVAGIQGRLRPGISPGYGYTAIIIAWLGRLNPWITALAAFLFGALLVGGEALQMSLKIPLQLTLVIQGLILFAVLAGDFVTRFRVRWVKDEPSPARGEDNA